MTRRLVTNDMSGHCRFGSEAHHHLRCHVEWDTPSATVRCACACHAENGIHGQVVVKKKAIKASGVVVKKIVR